jgi:uncharacterized membrane protein
MAQPQSDARLEAFCDGVFAIAITLLVIDLRLESPSEITSAREFWLALQHLLPPVFAFLLSFVIILITWVNHHATLKRVRGSSAAFKYANGLLLLTVAFIPFPTSLLGSFLWTDHAGPAVVLYNAVLAVQAMAWIAVTATALDGGLAAEGAAAATLRQSRHHGYAALGLYSLLAVLAAWLPFVVAIITTVSWMFWLAFGIRMNRDT